MISNTMMLILFATFVMFIFLFMILSTASSAKYIKPPPEYPNFPIPECSP